LSRGANGGGLARAAFNMAQAVLPRAIEEVNSIVPPGRNHEREIEA
jgi:hypothetical protein